MHPEEIQREIARVPHYKEHFTFKGREIGRPFDLRMAVQLFGTDVIPEGQGIYHLFYEGRIVYIGMSKKLRGRLLYHLKDVEKVFDAVLWYELENYSIEQILSYERKMIQYHTPPLNIESISGGY
jgi:hypothetical protein